MMVLALPFRTTIGPVSWARGATPHDDGTRVACRDVLWLAADDEEANGWSAAPARLPATLPRDEERGRPTIRAAPESGPEDG